MRLQGRQRSKTSSDMTTPDGAPVSTDRITRNQPKRAGPIRNFAGAPPRPNDGVGLATAVGTGFEAGQTALSVTGDVARGVVDAGVQTAYMVYEEYINRGREAAQRYRARRGDMCQSDWNQPGQDPWAQAWGPMAPMVAPWTQMMRLWAQSMSMWVPGAGEMASQWMSPGAWTGNGSSHPPRVTVSVTSDDPTEVTAELKPGSAGLRLSAEALKRDTATSDAPTIAGVTVDCLAIENRVRVAVVVPKDQPEGSYRGAVRDQFGNEQGHVVVRIQKSASTND